MSVYLPMLDHQRSPFGSSNFSRVYTPYGAFTGTGGPTLGFCGQRKESLIDLYPLGNGHRYYSPCLRRFISSDQLSPFGKGGINAYVYCGDDPVNRHDPDGRNYGQVAETAAKLFLASFASLESLKTFVDRVDSTMFPAPGQVNKPSKLITALEGATAIFAAHAAVKEVSSLVGGEMPQEFDQIAATATLTLWFAKKFAEDREGFRRPDLKVEWKSFMNNFYDPELAKRVLTNLGLLKQQAPTEDAHKLRGQSLDDLA
ncbi:MULTISPECIES: RHS repeat-associated core domain-containing protein [unclassified Pseudomonas]|jgi:RHS repeat-associated protein|uniref:RHS repeat-associated core domain-containing protein n=1 Tax=unclassified Pseudomonas TaxID=196821 RepID=UPI001E33417F|nr:MULTISPECIES: RHS repeat-associated core domain-containing protein [unclassified Pseudomonas]MCE0913302.1 RHS repeat-associated core domain-containing protein [Pseudomonas sp. NMI760_13]MCP8636294.1 RHS repeat-associated core domain-containing protein [Pseudomonas sp. DVZ6]MDC0688131.1 RHS repeat-associated core domain-containing protein [Mitsuaria sp. RG]MDD7785581.1 RHS repeat-associated core domain-containing protein [Pseudomonas sp. DVZ24]